MEIQFIVNNYAKFCHMNDKQTFSNQPQDPREMAETYLKLAVNKPERNQGNRSDKFTVDYGQISDIAQVSLLSTFNMFLLGG